MHCAVIAGSFAATILPPSIEPQIFSGSCSDLSSSPLMNRITLSTISGHDSDVFAAPPRRLIRAHRDLLRTEREQRMDRRDVALGERAVQVSRRRSHAWVPSRRLCASITSAWCGFSSGTIIGTSGVHWCAELFETDAASRARAYALHSSLRGLCLRHVDRAEDKIDLGSRSTATSDAFSTMSFARPAGTGVRIAHRPDTASRVRSCRPTASSPPRS